VGGVIKIARCDCACGTRACNSIGRVLWLWQGDDMYLTQVDAFLSGVLSAQEGGSNTTGRVLSPFDDAVKSYLLSVSIRDACVGASSSE